MANWTRRRFLEATAGVAALPLAEAAAAPEPKIPRRKLGKTGMEVSILGLGGGSQFLAACKTPDEAAELLNVAIDGGINYLDCAASYGDGESERRYGLVVPHRRKEVYVTSKTGERGRDGALRQVERSLRNMNVDYLDLIQVHSIEPEEDLDRILAKDGVYPALLELKRQGVVRNLGITGHLAARRMKALMDRMEELDTVLCPVNPYRDSRYYIPKREDDNPDGHFEQVLLPAARRRGLGIIAMKTMAQGNLVGQGRGKLEAAILLRYALSEPGVCTAIVGPGRLEYLRANLRAAQAYKPLSPQERRRLVASVSDGPLPIAYRDPRYRDA